MHVWVWIILVIVLVGLVVLLSDVQTRFFVSRVKNNDHVSIQIKALFGLVRYKIEIPIIKFKGIEQGIAVKAEHAKTNTQGPIDELFKKVTMDKITETYRHAQLLLANFFNFSKWLTQTLTHIRCVQLRWNTWIGLGDASDTAVSTGIVWALKSSLLGFALRHIQLDTTPKLQVIPQFNRMQFSTELLCIFNIRLGYALVAGLLFVANIFKVQGGMKTWLNIVFKV